MHHYRLHLCLHKYSEFQLHQLGNLRRSKGHIDQRLILLLTKHLMNHPIGDALGVVVGRESRVIKGGGCIILTENFCLLQAQSQLRVIPIPGRGQCGILGIYTRPNLRPGALLRAFPLTLFRGRGRLRLFDLRLGFVSQTPRLIYSLS